MHPCRGLGDSPYVYISSGNTLDPQKHCCFSTAGYALFLKCVANLGTSKVKASKVGTTIKCPKEFPLDIYFLAGSLELKSSANIKP